MGPGSVAWTGGLMYNHPHYEIPMLGETAIQPDIAQSAATLTAIGTGTAFGVLLLLIVLVLLIRVIATRILGGAQARAALAGARTEADAHDRALAAVIGVSALLAAPESVATPGDDG